MEKQPTLLLKDKVAFVTGSSRGIGAAIASLFAQNGANVAVHGRDGAALTTIQSKIERNGDRAIRALIGSTMTERA